MRILVMFDLPELTSADRREYRKFRGYLLKNGFLMLQESVYCRMALNKTVSDQIIAKLKKQKPSKGLVMVLTITEKQFQNMEIITGDFVTDVIDTDERLIIL
ncbi:MAG: CRISPR-associated endonuclease Cas2 [Oscillospiraceae bacterium]|nr:CRISPR-associated endonuclease Cas2 [Oscillospiraceae bacterium]